MPRRLFRKLITGKRNGNDKVRSELIIPHKLPQRARIKGNLFMFLRDLVLLSEEDGGQRAADPVHVKRGHVVEHNYVSVIVWKPAIERCEPLESTTVPDYLVPEFGRDHPAEAVFGPPGPSMATCPVSISSIRFLGISLPASIA